MFDNLARLLKCCRKEDDAFLRHIVSLEETWNHHYVPESKCESHIGSQKEGQNSIICGKRDVDNSIESQWPIWNTAMREAR